MPFACKQLGVVGLTVALLVVHGVTQYTVNLVLHGASVTDYTTFSSVAGAFLGWRGQLTVALCIFVNNFASAWGEVEEASVASVVT